MARTMSEEHRAAASARMKAMHERKRQEKKEKLTWMTVPYETTLNDPENSTEVPGSVPSDLTQREIKFKGEWMTDPVIMKKIDAILDVLTKLVPMIEVKPPKTQEAEDDVLRDLRTRITTNPKIKELRLTAEQVFKRVGVNPQALDNAVADNRAYWDALNLKLVETFMKVKK